MRAVKNSFGGLVVGIILVFIGIGLLWFNESNNVKNIKTVSEGRKVAIDVSSSKIDSKNDNKLVNVSGDLNILSENNIDNAFNVGVKTARLVRVVEIYQWDEKEENSDDNTTYSYIKKWDNKLIDSNFFDQPEGHQNPTSMPYENLSFLATDVKVGEFIVTDKEKDTLPLSKTINPLPTDSIIPTNYNINNQYITSSVDLQNPQIGDVRISFIYNDAKAVTILAGQSNNTFTDYKTDSGKSINMIREGKYTASQMLDYLETQNNTLKWILRVVGTLLIIFGLFAFMGPLTMIASFIPILGDLVKSALFVIAFLLGLGISLITIAIAWFVYRPVLGVLLLAGSIALFILLSKYIKSKKNIKTLYNSIPSQPVLPTMVPNPTPVNVVQTPITPTYPESYSNVQNNVPIQPNSQENNTSMQQQNNTNPQDMNNNSILH